MLCLEDNSLNFGVSTLEEIRLRKALKASMKKAGYPVQSADMPENREKENIQSFFRPGLGDGEWRDFVSSWPPELCSFADFFFCLQPDDVLGSFLGFGEFWNNPERQMFLFVVTFIFF